MSRVTGSIEEEDALDIDNWKQYWQSIFKEVTLKDIQEYEQKYKGMNVELGFMWSGSM